MALAAGGLAHGQALNRIDYRHYSHCLPDYLAALSSAARARREAAMAKLVDAASIEARQQEVREIFWKLCGGQPERTPLQVHRLGSFEREGYRLEKIVYQSRPDLVVTANLYRPTTGKPPYPGVLFQMGHAANGKANVPYQRCCQGLARLGYVVLAFDPLGQGERQLYPPAMSPTAQHSMMGRQLLLTGDSATGAMAWDAVRSLDVLATHPDVDPTRLASTGQSGGGMLTQILVCADPRLAAAAVSSGNTENFASADFIPPGPVDDAEQDFTGAGPAGFDRWDLLYPLAPKPLLIAVSAHDFFGTYSPRYLDDGRNEFARLAGVYERLGHRERIAWKETPLPHALTYALRVEIYQWFERWLKGSDRVIAAEPPVSPEKEETLWCGPAGNVARDFASRSPVAFSRSKPRLKAQTAAELTDLEAIREPRAAVLARVPSETVDVEAIEVASDPAVFLPAWVVTPRTTARTVLLVFDARGRNAGIDEGGLYQTLSATANIVICSGDVRGNGDLAPQVGRDNPGYSKSRADEENYASASFVLGRPLLVQRVADVLALIGAVAGRGDRIVIAARGKLTVPALFAASIDRRVSKLMLAGGTRSFREVLDAETSTETLANFLPSLLLHSDLPDIEASLAPRTIVRTGEDAWTLETLRAFATS